MKRSDLGRCFSAAIVALAIVLCSATSGMAASKNKKMYAYVTYDDGTVGQYRVSKTGDFTPLSPPRVRVPGDETVSVAVNPKARFAYLPATAQDDSGLLFSTVYQFRIGKDGTLVPLSPPGISSAFGIFQGSAIDRTGHFYYVAVGCVAHGGIAQYRIGQDGTLSPMKPPKVAGGNAPTLVVVHPLKPYVYLANRGGCTISAYKIGRNGALAPLDPANPEGSASGGGDMAFSPDGKYLYAANDRSQILMQYQVNEDGTLTELSRASFEGEICCGSSRVAVDLADGSAYLTETFSRNLFHFGLDSDGTLKSQPVETYRVTPDNKVKPASELKASVAGRVASMKLKPQSVEAQSAEHDAMEAITAAPAAITRAPDGAFYVVGNCGVSRFVTTKSAGVSSVRASATWADILAARKVKAASEPNAKPLGYPGSITIVAREE